MPPGGAGHHRPNNVSNPFNQFPQQHNFHANSHYQHQNYNSFNSNNFVSGAPGPTTGFPNNHQHGHSSLFGNGLSNGSGISTGNFGGALNGGVGSGLASSEAQMGFARGAMQEQAGLQDSQIGGLPRGSPRIREVWKGNLEQEMAMVRSLVDKYPYISMVCFYYHTKLLSLTNKLGHRVSRSSCKTNWELCYKSRLPLSMSSYKC